MPSTTLTTGQLGSLHPRCTREACRWVSPPHRLSSPRQCLPLRFVQTVVVADSLNRLMPRAVSGEMTTPSGAGACAMRSTGIGDDAPFTHTVPDSGPFAVLPPHHGLPHRTDHGHFPIAAGTSPVSTPPVGINTSDNLTFSHPGSQSSSTVQPRKMSRSNRPTQRRVRHSPRLHSDNDTPGCAAAEPVRFQVSARRTQSAAIQARCPLRL